MNGLAIGIYLWVLATVAVSGYIGWKLARLWMRALRDATPSKVRSESGVKGPGPGVAVGPVRNLALRILILQLIASPPVGILVIWFGAPVGIAILYLVGIVWTSGALLLLSRKSVAGYTSDGGGAAP
jgi:hypothetical protein